MHWYLRHGLLVHPKWLRTNKKDPYGHHCRPSVSREDIYRTYGLDLQDMTYIPESQDDAVTALMLYRGGQRMYGISFPGDLWRLSEIALGHGDPTGKEKPDPLPEIDMNAIRRPTRFTDWKGEVRRWRSHATENGNEVAYRGYKHI